MNIVRWEPFVGLPGLRSALDGLFEDVSSSPDFVTLWGEHIHRFPLDVYETDNEMVLKASLPGLKPEEVDISLSGDILTIKGETREEKEVKEEDYLRRERHYGAFSRSMSLPSGLNTDKIEAVFENGILTLTIPKAEEVKPRSIKVKAQGTIEEKTEAKK